MNSCKIIVIAVALTVLISCNSSLYKLQVENQYFEDIRNIVISEKSIENLSVMQRSNAIFLQAGAHSFSANSSSGLRITAGFTLQGIQQELILLVQSDGRVVLRQ